MNYFKLSSLGLALAALFSFNACDEEVDPIAPEVVTTMVQATSYTDWVYYSFSEDTIVSVADPANASNWDIALMRNHVRTNSGTSGSGQGGAFDAGVIDFDGYVTAPETGYLVDDSVQAFNFATMEYSPVAASSVLEGWGSFSSDTPPVFTPSLKVFAVKTATGKYVKLMFLNYYGTEGSGYITFKYLHQPDGSLNLQ